MIVSGKAVEEKLQFLDSLTLQKKKNRFVCENVKNKKRWFSRGR